MRIFEDPWGIATLVTILFWGLAVLGTKMQKWFPGDSSRLNPKKTSKRT